MHLGDLDGSAVISGSVWTASVSILVHDAAEAPLAGVEVDAKWSESASGSNQDASCTTNAAGVCSLDSGWLDLSTGSTTLEVKNNGLRKTGYIYDRAANHDPDGCETATCDELTLAHSAPNGRKTPNNLVVTPIGGKVTATPAQGGSDRQTEPEVNVQPAPFKPAPPEKTPGPRDEPATAQPAGSQKQGSEPVNAASKPLVVWPVVGLLWGIAVLERRLR